MNSDGTPQGPHRAEYLVAWGSAYTFDLPRRPEWATEELRVWPDRHGTGGRLQLCKTHNRSVIEWTLTLQLAEPPRAEPMLATTAEEDEWTEACEQAIEALQTVHDMIRTLGPDPVVQTGVGGIAAVQSILQQLKENGWRFYLDQYGRRGP